MDTEIITIPLLLAIGAAIAVGLHLLAVLLQRRAIRRAFGESVVPDPTSLRRLIIEWTGYAFKTLVWFLYFSFVAYLLPQTRERFETSGKRLERLQEHLTELLIDRGINILVTVVVTVFLMRFASALIKTVFALLERGASARSETATHRRLMTLSAIFRGAVQTVIGFIGLLTLLQQMKVNITPILASAGVVGIAVGFGAQSLIRDLFGGLMILLEDQYSVGDTVKIGETSGTVEQLTLRVTRVRGLDGALTFIPNGTISTVSNLSKDWSRAVLDIEIDYEEDPDKAMNVVLETARGLWQEKPDDITEEPAMLGIDKLSAGVVTLRLMVRTRPTLQFEIARELRRRIKLAYDERGIKTPLAKQQLLMPKELASAITETETAKKN